MARYLLMNKKKLSSMNDYQFLLSVYQFAWFDEQKLDGTE